ncbi:FG-GAP repeat protein [Pseudanabaena sp. Chao 1811]|uniref:FG-GAP repeat protein n=1 Tax=Pseudanabaena sp. Chao 1811 TaxID=2963092 RepID=UPI0022F3AD9A|nr:hypothetical protein [Pseudanabaena sp. Chao 1811]
MRFNIGFTLLGLLGLATALNGCFSASQSKLTTNIKNYQHIVSKTQAVAISTSLSSKLGEKCSEPRNKSPLQKFKLRKCRLDHQFKDIFILEKDNKEIAKWNAATYSMGFNAFEADLDGDGRQELIVASHNGTSNGLGVSYWTIYVLADPSVYPIQTPMRFSTQDYGGIHGTFVPDGEQFEIWTTAWEWTGTDNTLGIIGQQWRYQEGELISTTHPILKRWYSYNFQSERSKTHDNPLIPYLWLANSKVQAYEEHPLFQTTTILSIEDGTIQNINEKCTDDFTCQFTVDLNPNQGVFQTYIYFEQKTGLPQESDKNKKYFSYFGDWSSKRIYPTGYLPSDPNKWLKNKQYKVITYTDKYSSKFKVLWIM